MSETGFKQRKVQSDIISHDEPEKRPKAELFDSVDWPDLIDELLTISGKKGIARYQEIVGELNKIARRTRKRPWQWRYLQSVHSGTLEPSHEFAWTMIALSASLDDVPPLLAASEPVEVLASPDSNIGGSFVMAGAILCAEETCFVRFVPNHPSRRYCPSCRPPRSG